MEDVFIRNYIEDLLRKIRTQVGAFGCDVVGMDTACVL